MSPQFAADVDPAITLRHA